MPLEMGIPRNGVTVLEGENLAAVTGRKDPATAPDAAVGAGTLVGTGASCISASQSRLLTTLGPMFEARVRRRSLEAFPERRKFCLCDLYSKQTGGGLRFSCQDGGGSSSPEQ